MVPEVGTTLPTASLIVRQSGDRLFFEAKFRYQGRQIKRRVGPAWIEDSVDGWRPRPRRVPQGWFDERRAHVAAAGIVAEHVAEAENREQIQRERESAGVTFREVANDYMRWLSEVKGAKPATLRDRESLLAEPGGAYRRGDGKINGHVMAALGDRPASRITVREVNELLAKISKTGASASTVNKYRAVIVSTFNYRRNPTPSTCPRIRRRTATSAGSPTAPRCSTTRPRTSRPLHGALSAGRHREKLR